VKMLEATNRALGTWFIEGFDDTDNNKIRIQHGLVAGWVSIAATLSLFVLKMVLGLMAGSISVVADAFHLLSHMANSIILVVSFWVTSRPATAKTPFGHGRMEHYLGRRVDSHAILIDAFHHRIEAVITLTVIGGLVAGHHYHRPELDGYIGVLVSAWLLYLGFDHGREAIVPLLGKAPSKGMIQRIRETAKSVDGIGDCHEIILHDYGSMYLISAHVEVPVKFGAANMHEIAERCEAKLRKTFGGEAVCHTDPLLEKTPEVLAVEAQFRKIVEKTPDITGYHDFRVVAESPERIIIVADIDVAEEVPEAEFEAIASDLASQVQATIPNIAYSQFYVTPKFSY